MLRKPPRVKLVSKSILKNNNKKFIIIHKAAKANAKAKAKAIEYLLLSEYL